MNIVLICLDTYRADCVAALGRNDFIKTPNMDRLAAEGVLFENAFAEGLPTIQYRRALCTGMRSFPWDRSYDTKGLWPQLSGWHKIPPEQPTLAEVLLEDGWATGLVADTYHMFKPTQNFTRGMASWDFIRGQESDNYRCGPLDAIDIDRYTKKGVTSMSAYALIAQYLLNMNGLRNNESEYLPAMVFDSAIRFINDNKKNNPFFLWVDSFDPHEPWDPPAGYADMYDPDWDENWEPIIGLPHDLDEKTKRRVKALYYGSCTFVDKKIGDLLDALDGAGVADDTLVLVTSDHGCELWDHGIIYKNKNKCRYRHTSEIVCLMRLPGKAHAGKRIDAFVQNQDFFPTLLSAAGVEGPEVDGEDIMPLITGEKESVRDYVITGWQGCVTARSKEFAYCREIFEDDPDESLFDLQADPGEHNNIAAERPEVVREYTKRIEDYLGETLPATPRDKVVKATPPFVQWFDRAPWNKELRRKADWKL